MEDNTGKLQNITFVAGLRQVKKGIRDNKIKSVTLAKNADEHVKESVLLMCNECNIPIYWTDSKETLGESIGLDVYCAVLGELKQHPH